jgi:hypothetical protein
MRIGKILVAAACLLALGAPGAWADHDSDDVNCDAFATQAAAQAYAAAHPGDPDNLDADNDGLPCEELPAGTTATTTAPSGATTTTVASRTTTTTVAGGTPLARTGSNNGQLSALAITLVGGGLLLVTAGRRRRSAQR